MNKMTGKLQIGLVLPDVLGTYGDLGNAVVLRERAITRGIDAEIIDCTLDGSLPLGLDVYVLGGGEDTAQSVASEYLKTNNFRQVCDKGVPVLSVSAGMQILGNSYVDSYGRKLEGLGVLDIDTLSKGKRFIGEIVSAPVLPGIDGLLTGFENHAGVTDLGKDALPLGRVIVGKGNAGQCRQVDALAEHSSMQVWDHHAQDLETSVFNHFDGAFSGNIIGTYMHGPCLVRNPELADWLLSKAVGYPLETLEMEVIEELRRERLGKVLN